MYFNLLNTCNNGTGSLENGHPTKMRVESLYNKGRVVNSAMAVITDLFTMQTVTDL